MNPIEISLNLEHTYAQQLPGMSVSVAPAKVSDPYLLQFNESLSSELGFDSEQLSADIATRIFSGNELPVDARPIAQAYAGHQFGNFVPQLGDGRALLLGETIDRFGQRRDIALKGSGRTPFSRGGDGKAVIGPVLREYLIGEAMHALGIPTTRAIAAVATGEPVMRDRLLPGAILTRVATSHVRVGTFQFLAARGQMDHLQRLADYVLERHFPDVPKDQPYLSLLQAVVDRQAALVAQWVSVGFIHGVMNTDNMAIAGETIDYGPCAFMEGYDPATVFSSIDHGGRYAFGNQQSIALWNLTRFAETLLPLIEEQDTERAIAEVTVILESFTPSFQMNWYNRAWTKLGLLKSNQDKPTLDEQALVDDWLTLLAKSKADFTLSWRYLADAAEGDDSRLVSLLNEEPDLKAWLERWKKLHNDTPYSETAAAIRNANPIYLPRNELVEEALAAATDSGDLTLFESLLEVVQNPFEENPQYARYAKPASTEFTANYQTFCGT